MTLVTWKRKKTVLLKNKYVSERMTWPFALVSKDLWKYLTDVTVSSRGIHTTYKFTYIMYILNVILRLSYGVAHTATIIFHMNNTNFYYPSLR